MNATYFPSGQENDSSFHIFRTINGQECELALSEDELNLIYNIKAFQYLVDDIKHVAEEQELNVSDTTIETVARDFLDSYAIHPSYWEEIEDALRGEIINQKALQYDGEPTIIDDDCSEPEM
ncbi:MAG: hypothetical protein ACI4KM_10845 [Oscillospiraceae bacterium]